jgi:hypothetical protein
MPNKALNTFATLTRTFGTPRAFVHGFAILHNARCAPNAG